MESAPEDLSGVLGSLKESLGVRTAFLATVQGAFLASTHASGLEKAQLGAISAAALAIATKGVSDLQLGQLAIIHILGEAGSILVARVAGKAVLALVAEPASDLGALLVATKSAATRVAAFV